jgi:hypothetical protein
MMEVAKAILYELQPFRLEDVRIMINWSLESMRIVTYELSHLQNFIHSLDLPAPSMRSICLFFGWSLLYILCIWMKVGSVYFIISLLIGIFFNLGVKQSGETSAYSVFNQGYQSILGNISPLFSLPLVSSKSDSHR